MFNNFSEYKSFALKKQLEAPLEVAESIKSAFSLMESAEDVVWIAEFIIFIFGERLGKWEEGSDLFRKLKNNAFIADKNHFKRLTAILKLGNNPATELNEFSAEDKFIILSKTARALASLGATKNSKKLLTDALAINSKDYSKDLQRTHARLALNLLKANKNDEAKNHADMALDMLPGSKDVSENQDALDAYYVLAKISLLEKNTIGVTSSLNGMNTAFYNLDTDLQKTNQFKLDEFEK